MINEQKFSDASERDFGRRVEERFNPGILALLGSGVFGAILGGAAVFVARAYFAGDEPPIRVKGGSMEIDVLSKSAFWAPNGSAKKWKLHGGSRGKDDYDVTVVTSSTLCASQTVTGKEVEVNYTPDDAKEPERWVKLKSNGNKTEVIDASHALSLSTDKRQLYFSLPGRISTIKVDGYPFNFASKAEFVHALLMDF